jgi:hypothetical protein
MEDVEVLVMLRESEVDELLEAAVQRERARAVRIFVEESGGQLPGIICGELCEDGERTLVGEDLHRIHAELASAATGHGSVTSPKVKR